MTKLKNKKRNNTCSISYNNGCPLSKDVKCSNINGWRVSTF